MGLWENVDAWSRSRDRMLLSAADQSLANIAEVAFVQGELEPHAVAERQRRTFGPEQSSIPVLDEGHCVHVCLNVLTPSFAGRVRLEMMNAAGAVLTSDEQVVQYAARNPTSKRQLPLGLISLLFSTLAVDWHAVSAARVSFKSTP